MEVPGWSAGLGGSARWRESRSLGCARDDNFSLGWRAGSFGFFFDAGEGGFDGVADEVDEELLDLVGVGEEIDVGGGEKADVETDLERDDALEQREAAGRA